MAETFPVAAAAARTVTCCRSISRRKSSGSRAQSSTSTNIGRLLSLSASRNVPSYFCGRSRPAGLRTTRSRSEPSCLPSLAERRRKILGPTENILHFFSSFLGFWEYFPLQAVDFQPQPAIRTLQKKSYRKHYRRFYVRSGMCHNRRVNDEKFKVQSSKFYGIRPSNRPGWRRRQPSRRRNTTLMPSGKHQRLSVPSVPCALSQRFAQNRPAIKPNQTQSNLINVKKCFQQGLIGPDGRPNRQFLPIRARPLTSIRPQGLMEWAFPPSPSHLITLNHT